MEGASFVFAATLYRPGSLPLFLEVHQEERWAVKAASVREAVAGSQSHGACVLYGGSDQRRYITLSYDKNADESILRPRAFGEVEGFVFRDTYNEDILTITQVKDPSLREFLHTPLPRQGLESNALLGEVVLFVPGAATRILKLADVHSLPFPKFAKCVNVAIPSEGDNAAQVGCGHGSVVLYKGHQEKLRLLCTIDLKHYTDTHATAYDFRAVGEAFYRDGGNQQLLVCLSGVPVLKDNVPELVELVSKGSKVFNPSKLSMLFEWYHNGTEKSFLALMTDGECAFYNVRSASWGPSNGFWYIKDSLLFVKFHYGGVVSEQKRTLFELIEETSPHAVFRAVGTFAEVSDDGLELRAEVQGTRALKSWHIVLRKVPRFW
jgi:hypothetical protein